MSKPVILLIEPKPEVLWAITDDLQRQYNDKLRVMRADSDTTALEKLKKLQEQNDSVTLFVVEQQNSRIAGMEFLKLVMEMFPKAKQVLLRVCDTDDVSSYLPLPKAVIV